ncbi:MAG: hypothetical protein U0798_00490 [Gemmataceae bacterium]
MPIKVTCEKCGGVLHAPDDAGGKKGRCPNCQNILPIPFDAPRSPSAGFGAPAAPFGSPPSGMNPPPGLAFSSPANPVPPLFPNADAKRPTTLPPPFGMGARSETPGLESSSPGLPPPAAGMGSSLTRQSAPFGARPAPSTAIPIAPESAGWRSAAGGLRMIQIAVVLFLIAIVAPCGLAIYAANGGQNLADKAGMLKINNLSLLTEIRLASFLVPMVLGILMLLLGRFKASSVPASSCARGTASLAALSTLLSFAGLTALVVICALAAKDGFIPNLQPNSRVLDAETPMVNRVHEYLTDIMMKANDTPGQIQRFGLLGFIVFGKIAELFFGCTLGRISAATKNRTAAGRITRCYLYLATLAVIAIFGAVAFDLIGYHYAKESWSAKWYAMSVGVRTAIVAGTAGVICLLVSFSYLRMLGGARRACLEAGL